MKVVFYDTSEGGDSSSLDPSRSGKDPTWICDAANSRSGKAPFWGQGCPANGYPG